jgi:transmembrane sensor
MAVSAGNGDASSNQARIDQEAAGWLLRRSEGVLAENEEAEFQNWLREHPQNNLTFAAMSGVWAHTGGLKHLAHFAHPEPIQAAPIRVAQRFWIWGGLSAAAATVAALLFLATAGRHSTGVGETQVVSLPDGSSVVLGAKSQLRVKYSETERRVQLVAGEALFDVRHQVGVPFVVEAGGELVRDIGTRFDVNRSESSLRVFVLQGSVEVTNAAPAETIAASAPVEVLKAGDGLEASFRKTQGRAPIRYARTSPSAPDAWRRGWLVYENATLRDVVADVNRYYGPGVQLNPEVADLRVTASIRTSQIPSFLNDLGSALPVKLVRGAEGQIEVSPR